VFKAVQFGDKHKAWSLQKLIIKSQAARLLVVSQGRTRANASKNDTDTRTL
jgi:hypothetical protein